jgi:hypothetical protein
VCTYLSTSMLVHKCQCWVAAEALCFFSFSTQFCSNIFLPVKSMQHEKIRFFFPTVYFQCDILYRFIKGFQSLGFVFFLTEVSLLRIRFWLLPVCCFSNYPHLTSMNKCSILHCFKPSSGDVRICEINLNQCLGACLRP